jgi:hypothetical protein
MFGRTTRTSPESFGSARALSSETMDSARHAAFESAESPDSDPAAAGNTAVDLAVDLAAERPAEANHGLRPDRMSRWIGRAVLGATLVVIATVAIVRSASDDDAVIAAEDREVPLLEPQLREPLEVAVISLERVRLEWMTTEMLRTLDRPIASTRTAKAPVHTSTAPTHTSTAPTHTSTAPAAAPRRPTTNLSDLPAPNVAEPTPAREPVADAPPAEAPPAEAPVADAPPAEAPPAEPPSDAPDAPLPGVDAPEPEPVDDEV